MTRDFPCLYCLALDGNPSVEHVVPAGLGRHADIELPSWAVCSRCNNMLGRQVDEALVHAFEVLFARGINQVPDHKGRRVKSIDIREGKLEFGDDGQLHLTQFAKEAEGPWERPEPGSTVTLPVTLRRRRYRDQRRRVARTVLKIGLGVALLEKGPSFALHPDFDAARSAVLGAPYDGYLLSKLTAIDEPPHLHVHLLSPCRAWPSRAGSTSAGHTTWWTSSRAHSRTPLARGLAMTIGTSSPSPLTTSRPGH